MCQYKSSCYKIRSMTKEQLAATNLAIKRMGGIVQCAATMGCTLAAIQFWRTRGVPKKHLETVVKATAITGKRLRPDLYQVPQF